jgi:opacity protein-like surface antigen
MIRKLLLTALALVLVSSPVLAQRPSIEIQLLVDYLWTTSMSGTYQGSGGNYDIKNNPGYGFAIDVEIRPGTELEFLYLRQDSDLTFTGGSFQGSEDIMGLVTSYYHVGAIQGFPRGNVKPFTGLTLGATQLAPQDIVGLETQWKFSFAFNAGAKIYVHERIGIRLQGRLLASFLDAGAGMWLGTGGVSLGVTGTALWQWDLGGGLIIRL